MNDLVVVFGNYQELVRFILFEAAYIFKVQLCILAHLRLESYHSSSLFEHEGSEEESTLGAEKQL
jgi:hypothetical protein